MMTDSSLEDLNQVSILKTLKEKKRTMGSLTQPSFFIEHKASRSMPVIMVDIIFISDSFEEMYESTTKDFKPKEGETPDNMWRFHIDDSKVKTKSYKDSDSMNVIWAFSAFAIFSAVMMYLKKIDTESAAEN